METHTHTHTHTHTYIYISRQRVPTTHRRALYLFHVPNQLYNRTIEYPPGMSSGPDVRLVSPFYPPLYFYSRWMAVYPAGSFYRPCYYNAGPRKGVRLLLHAGRLENSPRTRHTPRLCLYYRSKQSFSCTRTAQR